MPRGGAMEHVALTGGGEERLAVWLEAPPGGKAPAAILYAHGFRSDQRGEKASFFRRRAVATGLAFCSFDFRGHGASDGELAETSLTRNLADIDRVYRFLTERIDAPVVFFGSSLGAASLLWHAVRHPEHAAAAVCIAPAVTLGETLAALVGEAGLEAWRRHGVHRFEDEMGAVELSWTALEDLRAHRLEELVNRNRTPALVFQGARDDRVDWRGAVDLATAGRVPVELHLFADGDHRLVDRLERLWALAEEFLGSRGLLEHTVG